MSLTSTAVAGGTTGALPDANPKIDRVAGVDTPFVKLLDATTDATTAIGIDANPLKVQPRRKGTSDYDSGLVAVASGAPVQITAATIYPERGYISNPTSSAIDVTLQKADGTTFLVATIAANGQVPFPIAGALVGLKAGASAAGLLLSVFGGQ